MDLRMWCRQGTHRRLGLEMDLGWGVGLVAGWEKIGLDLGWAMAQ